MEMTANEGSVNTGNPENAHTSASEGSSAQGGDFLSALSEDNRKTAEAKGWTNPESFNAVLDSYRGLESKIGSALTIPGEDAAPEDHNAFFEKASKTWTPEAYEFQLAEDLPQDFPYDSDFAKQAESWFKEVGLHPSQAQALHDKWVGKMAEAYGVEVQQAQEAEQAREAAAATAHRDLVKEFGEPGTESYDNLIAKAERAMSGLDASDWLTEKGILTAPGEKGERQVLDPKGVRILAKIADGMFLEDGLNGNGSSGKNPFADGSVNLTEQSNILRNRPKDAKALIKAAGKDPAKFNL